MLRSNFSNGVESHSSHFLLRAVCWRWSLYQAVRRHFLFCCARCTSRVGQGRHYHGREVARFTWLHNKPPTRDATRLFVTFLSLRHYGLQNQRRFLLCVPATPWFVLPQAIGSSLYSWTPTMGLQRAAALLV